jgi:hypothetical protein
MMFEHPPATTTQSRLEKMQFLGLASRHPPPLRERARQQHSFVAKAFQRFAFLSVPRSYWLTYFVQNDISWEDFGDKKTEEAAIARGLVVVELV